MRRFGISAVEQPVARGDLEGLRLVTSEVPETVIADESACSPGDVERLVAHRACDVVNVRVSKCGGLLRSERIARMARGAGMDVVVGAQVGESGLLSAAGRHLAARVAPRYVEGSPGRLLLAEDLVVGRVLPGRGGRAPVFDGAGLGVTVARGALARRGTMHATLRAELVA
jgi:muconate cycloisomerase